MDFNYILNEGIDYNLLIKYGFKFLNDKYQYKVDLRVSNLYLIVEISDQVIIRVIDKDFDDEYLPIKTNTNGEFSSQVLDEVKNIIMDIKDKCVSKHNLVKEIKEYVKDKDEVLLEYPWSDTPDYCTLKVNKKWFGLIMNVKYKVLGIQSDEIVDIINIKLDPLDIENLIDNKTYFKAYHMNKKYWITILLNGKIEKNKLFRLIDKSYDIVSNKK